MSRTSKGEWVEVGNVTIKGKVFKLEILAKRL